MSELKTYTPKELVMQGRHNEPIYLKSEADKVIAELEESHKMEVDQLLIEIAELKDKALQYKVLHEEHCRNWNTQERFFAEQIAHHKYKRCLGQVENCRTSSVYFFHLCEREKDEGKAAEYRRVSDWFDKWEERWLELAEKFKEAS